MKQLSILIKTCDASYLNLIIQLYDLGHFIHVQTDNSEIIQYCLNERVDMISDVQMKYDFIISNNFNSGFLNYAKYLCTPTLSSRSPPKLSTVFGYWSAHQLGYRAFTFGHTKVQHTSESITDILISNLIFAIIEYSRDESSLTYHNPNIPISLFSQSLTTTINRERIFSSIKTLISRYFKENECIVQSSYNISYGELESVYDVCPFDTIKFNEDQLLLIDSKSILTDKVENPLAILSLNSQEDKTTLQLYSNSYVFENFLTHLNLIINTDKNENSCEFISRNEQDFILNTLNNNSIELPNESIVDVFERNVQENPTKTAIIFGDDIWTYEKLYHKAVKICKEILSKKLEPETPIILAMERSPLAIAAMLGILRADCCYVPLDPSYPKERIASILKDTKAPLCLAESASSQLFDIQLNTLHTIWVDQIEFCDKPLFFNHPKINPCHLAYIIYTSGSTGSPKGVMIEHRSIINLVKSAKITCDLSSTSMILNVASLGFDAAGWDIYGALLNGAT